MTTIHSPAQTFADAVRECFALVLAEADRNEEDFARTIEQLEGDIHPSVDVADTGWVEPDPDSVVLFHESGLREPYDCSGQGMRNFKRVIAMLEGVGLRCGFESINAAVSTIFILR